MSSSGVMCLSGSNFTHTHNNGCIQHLVTPDQVGDLSGADKMISIGARPGSFRKFARIRLRVGERQSWRKHGLWEEATRVPLIVVAPGLTNPGQRCTQPVDLVSLYPALCDVRGLPRPDHLESASLRPLLANPAAAWNHPALTTWGRGNHALRHQHWRYLRYADGAEELYDHRNDPHEWMNLAGRPELAAVKRHLGRLLPAKDAPPAPGGGSSRED
jgi:arylsulfatase A-like enzyme